MELNLKKSNFLYTCGITSKCVTIGGAHLRGLAVCNAAPKKRRSGGEPLATLPDLTGPRIEPQTSRAASDVYNHYAHQAVELNLLPVTFSQQDNLILK